MWAAKSTWPAKKKQPTKIVSFVVWLHCFSLPQQQNGSRDGNVGRSVHYLRPNLNISMTIRWIAMRLVSDILGAQRLNCDHFSELFMYFSSSGQKCFDVSPNRCMCT